MTTLIKEASVASITLELTAADAVWIATASLHKKHPTAAAFAPDVIHAEVVRQHLTNAKSNTIHQHIVQHLVATLPRNPNRRRMLTEVGEGLRRLYLPGDPVHPSKNGGQTIPDRNDLPVQLHHWLKWYDEWAAIQLPHSRVEDPLLALIGSGKDIWADEHADEYVENLRKDWE